MGHSRSRIRLPLGIQVETPKVQNGTLQAGTAKVQSLIANIPIYRYSSYYYQTITKERKITTEFQNHHKTNRNHTHPTQNHDKTNENHSLEARIITERIETILSEFQDIAKVMDNTR